MKSTANLEVFLVAKGFKFEDNSGKVKNQLLNVGIQGLTEAALLIEGAAKSNAPVNLGELRDKIDYQVKEENGGAIAQIGSPLDYAFYPEFGTGEFAENGAGRKGGWSYQDESGVWHYTKGQRPQPYLRPAFRQNKKNIEDIIGQKFGSEFNGK